MSRQNPTIYSSKGRVCFLNVSNSHWVTVSNIGFKPGIVNIFDSIPNNPISSHTKEQIAANFSVTKKKSNSRPVQVQHGDANCEVFAVAFATAHAQEETLLI